MKLSELLQRTPVPAPWSEGEKIPWNEPGFSRRMLREHLDPGHDAASRRQETIDRQVAWLHETVRAGKPGRVLDLGCGPGLYTSRLAALGHTCLGVDFSPASIAYAREQASATGSTCRYVEGDMRALDLEPEGPFELAMLLFGELNTFRADDAAAILAHTRRTLSPAATLVLEPQTFDAVRAIGQRQPRWVTHPQGLFSERPHLLLEEAFWDEAHAASTQRWHVIDAGTSELESHASSTQAYSEDDYRALLEQAEFEDITFFPSLTGRRGGASDLCAITARPRATT